MENWIREHLIAAHAITIAITCIIGFTWHSDSELDKNTEIAAGDRYIVEELSSAFKEVGDGITTKIDETGNKTIVAIENSNSNIITSVNEQRETTFNQMSQVIAASVSEGVAKGIKAAFAETVIPVFESSEQKFTGSIYLAADDYQKMLKNSKKIGEMKPGGEYIQLIKVGDQFRVTPAN